MSSTTPTMPITLPSGAYTPAPRAEIQQSSPPGRLTR
jgi:hypothetical protein